VLAALARVAAPQASVYLEDLEDIIETFGEPQCDLIGRRLWADVDFVLAVAKLFGRCSVSKSHSRSISRGADGTDAALYLMLGKRLIPQKLFCKANRELVLAALKAASTNPFHDDEGFDVLPGYELWGFLDLLAKDFEDDHEFFLLALEMTARSENYCAPGGGGSCVVQFVLHGGARVELQDKRVRNLLTDQKFTAAFFQKAEELKIPMDADSWFDDGVYWLQFAPARYKADRQFVLTAVEYRGDALQFVDQNLQSDREIVLAAVQQCGHALQYAAPELRANQEIVSAAVHNNQSALQFASVECRNGFTKSKTTEGRSLVEQATAKAGACKQEKGVGADRISDSTPQRRKRPRTEFNVLRTDPIILVASSGSDDDYDDVDFIEETGSPLKWSSHARPRTRSGCSPHGETDLSRKRVIEEID